MSDHSWSLGRLTHPVRHPGGSGPGSVHEGDDIVAARDGCEVQGEPGELRGRAGVRLGGEEILAAHFQLTASQTSTRCGPCSSSTRTISGLASPLCRA